jgi:Alr-MurF fusion protein
MSHLTWVEVDLAAIQNNLRQMKALTHTRMMAVVKANAYGHGAVEVARAAASAGADWLGVARAPEGLALRAAGLTLPILVLGYTLPDSAAEVLGADLTLTVFDIEAAKMYAAAARALGRRVHVHVKVDTGMGRLGVPPEDAVEFVRTMRALEDVEVDGVFTHFAGADLADQSSARRQLAKFETVLAALDGSGPRAQGALLVHAANSAAALTLPAARFDVVRMGIALYGLHPSDAVPCPPGFVPALTWKAIVTQVKTLPPGHGISYGSEYVTAKTETIAVIPIGYADGFRRIPQNVNEVLIHGQRAPMRGRVCMDQIIAGVSHIPGVRAGDEVVLVGKQGGETMSADEVARRWGTINYDVTSGIMARVARVYSATDV